MNKLICIALCFVGVALAECKSTKTAIASPPRTSTDVKPAAPDPVAMGQEVFQNKCYQCHNLPHTSDYTQSEWSDIMVKMSRKAHLSETETEQVLAFVNKSAKQ